MRIENWHYEDSRYVPKHNEKIVGYVSDTLDPDGNVSGIPDSILVVTVENKITKTEVCKGTIGYKKGWAFKVTWDDRPYPNLVSGLYKTKKTATEKLQQYLKTGDYDCWGDAEVIGKGEVKYENRN